MNFWDQHKNVIIVGGLSLLGCVVFVVWLVFGQNSGEQAPPPAAQDEFISSTDFLNADISDEDKRLMLLGVIYAEAWTTFEDGDFSGLVDLENQSTDNFKTQVGAKISQYESNPSREIIGTADDSTVTLNRPNESEARISMTVNIEERGVSKKSTILVQLTRSGEYWLISNILAQ